MTETISPYSIGDWVVHHVYGIGQINQIEEKPIQGELTACFRVKAESGAYWWFPRNNVENPRVRPVATQANLRLAQQELKKTVQDLDSDWEKWLIRIDEVRAGDALIATSQLVRDLTILQTKRRLNQTEESALSHFTNRLLREWAATMNMDVAIIRLKLNDFLQGCKERASAKLDNE